jgi:glucokinase
LSNAIVIGIDLGGTNCRGALATPAGELLGARHMPTHGEEGRDAFLKRFLAFCRQLMDEAGQRGLRVDGLGLGAPGIVTPDGRICASPNLKFLEGFPFAEFLHDRLQVPTTVVNDASAVALGEAVFGAGREHASFLVVTLGTGVGGALFLDGRLWQGVDGSTGEVGHVAVESRGRPCRCGSHGCLEQYASAGGIALNYLEECSSLSGTADSSARSPSELSTALLARLAREGDRAARNAFHRAGRYLGQAVAGIVNLLNLEAVILTGGVSASYDLLEGALRDELDERAFAVNARRVRLMRGQLGDSAGILGAASLFFDCRDSV